MKKVLIIMLLFLLVGCNKIEDKEEPTVDPKDPEYVVTINLFHWNQCSHCKEEITWLKELDERRDDIKINYYEVNEYPDLVESVREELYVLSEGVPLTVIGTDYILGFGDSTKARITNLIDKYADKDYCDIVSLIINGEDTTKCYLQNN